jgi:hypothetical protein
MKNIRWVIQDNLISEQDLKTLQNTAREIGCDVEEVFVTPFVKTLPKFTLDDKKNVYYGSTTMMMNVYKNLNKPLGLFFDDKAYSMENYIDKWGENMLSCEAEFTTIGEIMSIEYQPQLVNGEEIDVFVRPDGDTKSFDGEVGKASNFIKLFKRKLEYDMSITEDTKILVGPAYNIVKEWRNYVVGGEIVTSTKYRQNFRLNKSATDIPEDMLEYTRKMIEIYKPHENFAIDIAQMDDGSYYIIECGCLNSVGFYHADIKQYVKSVTEWMIKQ